MNTVAGSKRVAGGVVRGRSRAATGPATLVSVAAIAVLIAVAASTSFGGDNNSNEPFLEPTAGPMTPREASDRFWSAVAHFGLTNYKYESLDEMTADADLIIRGRLIGITRQSIQSFEKNPLHESLAVPFGIVAIDEVLKGEPASQTAGEILVARLGIADLEPSSLPKEQLILFLNNYAQMRIDMGVDASSDADDNYLYAQPNGYQCVLREFDGAVALVPGPEGWEESMLGPFPSELDGAPIGEITAAISRVVGAVPE